MVISSAGCDMAEADQFVEWSPSTISELSISFSTVDRPPTATSRHDGAMLGRQNPFVGRGTNPVNRSAAVLSSNGHGWMSGRIQAAAAQQLHLAAGEHVQVSFDRW
jgi:hypothetical protein